MKWHTVKLVPLLIRLVLENVALLLEAAADECIEFSEEALEFRILVGVSVDLVDGIEEVVERGVVGESLQKGL